MGKKVKYTGSVRLGEELRRLRGGRTLGEIAALSRTRPLVPRTWPIAAPTLCQIETGVSMPSIESLYTLSILYKVSAQQLLDLIVEDRLGSATVIPTDPAEVPACFSRALQEGRWYDALALARHSESAAKDEATRIQWRANRASCMGMLGMRQEAIWLLLECISSSAASAAHRYKMELNLADALATAGFIAPALDAVQRAIDGAPDDAPAMVRAAMLRTRAQLLVQLHEHGVASGDGTLHEALHLLKQARSGLDRSDVSSALFLDIEEALALRWLGNELVAGKRLADAADAARKHGLQRVEMFAEANLGVLRRVQKRFKEAERRLLRAEDVAVELKQVDEAFDIYFELYLVAQGRDSRRAAYYLKRCERYYPLVHARSPNALRYEQLVRRQA